ncbi:SGNH/GDSL hydrolase family protein [Cereibacter azotoformans]|uniref:Lysophospholipase L1-like esterase n=1 Tax=Cereibacter azotoformans TaxID=43057 RepID=A0A2T5JVS3_9RHOB|nr:SGNH/GDSL hydrolase family protein [Cereibacter azotoformans]PTR14275.1 lysophospholipase L1-like esterase [Cereibacter azotoformans]
MRWRPRAGRDALRTGAVLLALVAGGLAAWSLGPGRPAPAPQDRLIALHLPADRPLRLTILGTSLSHGEPWTERLGTALAACRGQGADIAVIARPGSGVDWGVTQVAAVAATRPDVLLIEFAINDADLWDGTGLAASRARHAALLRQLRRASPGTAVFLMTMSPAQGLRGALRPRLGAHYRQYVRMAEEMGAGVIDLHPRWLARPRAERGLGADGLHPDPQVAAQVIVPAVAGLLTRAAGLPGCPPAPVSP